MARTLTLAGVLLLWACGPVGPTPEDSDVVASASSDADGVAPASDGAGLVVALNLVSFPTGAHSVRLRLLAPGQPTREIVRELDQPEVLLYVDTLAPGTWLLTLEVLDPSGNTIYCGSRFVQILDGATTQANVLLSPSGPCVPMESECSDGSDDDFDGATDCADSDCAGHGCDDGNQCTLGDTCSAGACVGPTPKSCDDSQACTSDSCVPAVGCVSTVIGGCGQTCTIDAECDDQGLCQGAGCHLCTYDHCVDGFCANDPLDGTSCDDANPCTSADTCSAGHCAGTVAPGTGTTEVCNGEDDDCDGATDEPFSVGAACTDSPTYNECRNYERECAGDQQSSVCVAVGLKDIGSPCGATQCSDGILVTPGSCWNGICLVAQPEPCAPFTCADATHCGTGCQSDSDCAAGYNCDGGACVLGGELGQACSDDGECLSDHCADNVCCEDACDGPCHACDGTGSCNPVPTQTDPTGDCPGSCDGNGDFIDGVCSSAGDCEPKTGGPADCGAYLCTPDGCMTECAPAAPQCANGVTCVDNACCDGGVDLNGGVVALSVPLTGTQDFSLCVSGGYGVAFGYTSISKQIRRVLEDSRGVAVVDGFIGPGPYPEDQEPLAPGLYRLRLSQLGGETGPVTGNLQMWAIPSPGGGLASLDGTPVANTMVTVPGQDVVVTYPGVAGNYLSIRVAGLVSEVTRTDPDGFPLSGGGIINTPMFFDAAFLTKTGTYTMRFDPLQIATGSMTLQYWNVPPDLETTATTDGVEVLQTITIPGQDAGVSFTGTAGTHVSISVGCPTSVTVRLRTSAGAQVGGTTTCTQFFRGVLSNLTLPSTGGYRVDLDPQNDAGYAAPVTIGTRVFAWTSDALATVPIDVSTVVPAPYPGQRLQVLFDATSGTQVSALLAYSGCAIPDPIMNSPAGTQVGAADFNGGCEGAFIPPVTIGSSGTYRIIVDFYDAVPPSPTVTVFDVTTRASASATINGGTVSLPITKPGQLGEVTFGGTSAQTVRFTVSGTVLTGTTNYKLIAPSGAEKYSASTYYPFTSSAVTLDETGTWKVVVDPESSYTGASTIALISP